MSQEVFNQLLANSPLVAILLYIAKTIKDLCERVARLEGAFDEHINEIKR